MHFGHLFALCLLQGSQGLITPSDVSLGGRREVEVLLPTLPAFGSEWVPGEGANPGRALSDAELASRIKSGAGLSDDQWMAALVESGAIRMRGTWPVGTPFAVSLREPSWTPWLSQIRLTSRWEPFYEVYAGELTWRRAPCMGPFDSYAPGWYEPLGVLPLGHQQLEFDVEVLAPGKVLWRGAFRFDSHVVERLDQVLTPLRTSEAAAVIRSGLRVKTHAFQGAHWARLYFDLSHQPDSAFDDVAVSLAAEFSRRSDGLVVPLTPCTDEDEDEGVVGFVKLGSGRDPSECAQAFDAKLWTVRVFGTDQDVLEDWDATSYWSGELTLPLEELLPRD